MRFTRTRKPKPLTNLQMYSESFKETKTSFLREIDDSRYSLYALEISPNEFVWESNFCGIWIATHADIYVVMQKISQHYRALCQNPQSAM